ncbi:MAG TPA: response regulator [Rhizomicrobium sp.]|nr:response regulator [Rhizomicrobium sp.]
MIRVTAPHGNNVMQEVTTLVSAVASLLWPLILIIIIFVFYRPVRDLIESARSRQFTLKFGGQELTMNEVSKQWQLLIADLQSNVGQLKKRLVSLEVSKTSNSPAAVDHPVGKLTSVLWVDDEPKNNSYFVAELHRLRVRVDLARTTFEALSNLRHQGYSVIISDMWRKENNVHVPQAGFDLLKQVREVDQKIPFFFYCSDSAVRKYREEAITRGANAITASASELHALLNLNSLSPLDSVST